MIRCLLGLLLAEAVVAGGMLIGAWSSGLLLQGDWRVQALAADADLARCEAQANLPRMKRR